MFLGVSGTGALTHIRWSNAYGAPCISCYGAFRLQPSVTPYAAFRLACRSPHCRFDDDICTTAQSPLDLEGWPSGKQRLASRLISLPLCPPWQIADSWTLFNSGAMPPRRSVIKPKQRGRWELQLWNSKRWSRGVAASGKLVWNQHYASFRLACCSPLYRSDGNIFAYNSMQKDHHQSGKAASSKLIWYKHYAGFRLACRSPLCRSDGDIFAYISIGGGSLYLRQLGEMNRQHLRDSARIITCVVLARVPSIRAAIPKYRHYDIAYCYIIVPNKSQSLCCRRKKASIFQALKPKIYLKYAFNLNLCYYNFVWTPTCFNGVCMYG